MKKTPTFILYTRLFFRGTFTIRAEDEQKAREIVNDHCGLCIGGDIHTTWNDKDVHWNFDPHAEKQIGKVQIVSKRSTQSDSRDFTSFEQFAMQLLALTPYDSVDFSTDPVESCGWGVKRMPLMDSDLLIVGMYGQGEFYLYNLSIDGQCPEDIEEFLRRSLMCHTTQGVWL